jgi:hypothetical protein
MKSKFACILLLFSLGIINIPVLAQKVYPVTSGEIIFSQGSGTSFTQEFLNQYPQASMAADNVRFTCFFHLGQYFHMDLTNSFGLYSGIAVRNVGMITDEYLPQTISSSSPYDGLYNRYNIVRRQYMLGVPLAIKLGSFKNHFYAFGGGEYEMAFAFKEKYWTDSYDRSGPKTKSVQWFASQTPTFMPSLFVGIQFPAGFNIKFKYYLNDFLNNGYKVNNTSQDGSTFSLSDLTRYQSSRLVYVSLCWQFNTSDLWNWDHN